MFKLRFDWYVRGGMFKLRFDWYIIPSDYERKDHITKLSYLAARPLLARVHSFFFCLTDRPTFTRGRAMGNETFYWDGLICQTTDQRICYLTALFPLYSGFLSFL